MIKEIVPPNQIRASVNLPGSKYIANRLLPLCALATSESRLSNLVNNDDINTAISGLTQLGYQFERGDDSTLLITPKSKSVEAPASLYTAHSGTFSRFVTAIAALETQNVEILCSEKMATRPMDELFTSLRQLGVTINSPNQCLPATITGPITGNRCELDASRSSQYLSALLIVAPLLEQGLTIDIGQNLVSSDRSPRPAAPGKPRRPRQWAH